MKTEDLKKEIAQSTARLRTVEDSLASHQKRIAALTEERSGHIVAARAGKDATAQGHLDRLASEIAAVQREERDDTHAAAEISKKLATLNADLARADFLERLDHIRKMVKARVADPRQRRLAELVDSLRAVLEEIVAADRGITEALYGFGHGLELQVGGVHNVSSLLGDLVSYGLRDLVPSPLGGEYKSYLAKQSMDTAGCRRFQAILEALDAMTEHQVPA